MILRTVLLRCTLGIALVLAAAAPAGAWHGNGHHRATTLAVGALPDEVPAFFREGAATIAHCSLDPDTFTRPMAPPALHNATSPEHYFDLEVLGGRDIPADRYALLMWCGRQGVHPSKIGLAPYAIQEWTERLAVAFAEHRRWPANVAIHRKCLVYAGHLAHYAEDLCMPLHTTIHYDGRAKADGSSPKSGIHLKVDALLGKLPLDAGVRVDPKAVTPFKELFPAILAELKASHALVEKVYAMEKALPAYADPLPAEGEVAAFARERLAAAATFTARLYATAWRLSASIEIPEWHVRPAVGAPAGTGAPADDRLMTSTRPAAAGGAKDGADAVP